jgi:hypothetical protein
MIEDTIYTLLSAVGTVFPKIAKQAQNSPYMVYTVISNIPSKRKNGVSITDIMRLQVDIYATSAKSCNTLYESLRTALDYKSSGSITHISYDSHWDDFDEAADYYCRSVDFLLRIKR